MIVTISDSSTFVTSYGLNYLSYGLKYLAMITTSYDSRRAEPYYIP